MSDITSYIFRFLPLKKDTVAFQEFGYFLFLKAK